jgi:ribonucleoside-diphosphate reductase alpha chain/ribonucleoside-triphosphate reductase
MDSWQKLSIFSELPKDAKRSIINSCNTTVFEFPVSAPKGDTIGEVGVIKQLDSLLSFSINYTDHMPSCTISVKEGEWELIPDWIIDKWDKGFTTASFLSYSDSNYPLLPYEAVDEGEFNKRMEELGERVIRTEQSYYLDVDLDLLSSYERSLDATEIIEEACGTGSCPIR